MICELFMKWPWKLMDNVIRTSYNLKIFMNNVKTMSLREKEYFSPLWRRQCNLIIQFFVIRYKDFIEHQRYSFLHMWTICREKRRKERERTIYCVNCMLFAFKSIFPSNFHFWPLFRGDKYFIVMSIWWILRYCQLFHVKYRKLPAIHWL